MLYQKNACRDISTKKNLWRDILHQVFFFWRDILYPFFCGDIPVKKIEENSLPYPKKTKDIDISTKKSQETLQKIISRHMFYQKLPIST